MNEIIPLIKALSMTSWCYSTDIDLKLQSLDNLRRDSKIDRSMCQIVGLT